MGKRKRRGKHKASECSATDADSIANSTDMLPTDSEPLIHDEKFAWKCVMALTMERYILNVDTLIARECDKLTNQIPRSRPGRLLLQMGELLQSVSREVDRLEECKKVARGRFVSNLARMNGGVKYEELPLIDEELQLSELEDMIAAFTNAPEEHSDSTSGGDSAIADASLTNTQLSGLENEDATEEAPSTEDTYPSFASTDEAPPTDEYVNETTCDGSAVTAEEVLRVLYPPLDTQSYLTNDNPGNLDEEYVSDTEDLTTTAGAYTQLDSTEFPLPVDDPAVVYNMSAEQKKVMSVPQAVTNVDVTPTLHVNIVNNVTLLDSAKRTTSDNGDWEMIIKRKKSEAAVPKEDVKLVVNVKPTTATSELPPPPTPMENGKFASEKGAKWRKTEMCRAYKEGRCSWAEKCNYAHSKAEMEKALSKLADDGAHTRVFENTTLKAQMEDPTPAGNVKFMGSAGSRRRKTQICENFKQGKCNWGPECNYAHSLDELQATDRAGAVGGATNELAVNLTPAENPRFAGTVGKQRRKMEMCSNFKAGICNWGRSCNYAHSPEELKGSGATCSNHIGSGAAVATKPSGSLEPANGRGTIATKLMMCRGYQQGTCNWPPELCKYAHDVSELDQRFDHTEPCGNQQCAGRLRHERRMTMRCPDAYQGKKCKFGANCTYAHTRAELRPLPKHELCHRHARDNCLDAALCVYAHSNEELRPKPSESTAKLERSFAKSSVNHNAWSNQAAAAAADDSFKHIEGDDECLICCNPLGTDRQALECAHNSWHLKCISRWLNEGSKFCPLCTTPAQLPDLYVAPAGFAPEDFPIL